MADGSTPGGVEPTLIQVACHSGLRISVTTAATGQCEVRGNDRRCIHRRVYISEARWDARYFTLQPFSLMPPVAAPDLSSRPGPRARITLVRPGEATVILKCPGRRYHSVERVADSMFFGVSTWTFRFLNFLLAVSWLFPRIVTGRMYRTSCFKKQRFCIIMQHAILLSGRVESVPGNE